MTELLQRLVDASLQGLIAFVAVFVIVHLFRGLNPSAKCWLWRLCGLKLIVSMAFVFRLPILPDVTEDPHVASSELLPATSAIALEVNSGQQIHTSNQLNWPMLFATVWAVVAGILALRQLIQFARERGRLLDSTEQIPSFLGGFGTSSRVLISKGAESPLVLGLFWPVILLPSSLLPHPELIELAIRHEEAHIRRRDLIWQAVLSIVGCCFWFLPPAHWIERLARCEAEQACDLEVVGATGNPGTYFRFLIQLAQDKQAAPGFAGMASESRDALARRINAVKRTRIRWQFGLLALVIATPALVPIRAVGQESRTAAPRPSIDSLAKKYLGVIELDFSPEQRQRFTELAERHNKETRDLGNKLQVMKKTNVSDKERIAYDISVRMPLFNRQTEERWNVLTEAQKQRQRQVTLQYLGPMSIGNKEVAKLVGVPEPKRIRIKALADQYRKFTSEQAHTNWMEARDVLSREVKIREYTVAEKERIELLKKEIYTASGERRTRLKKDLSEIQRRGVRYETNQEYFSGRTQSFKEARTLAIQRLMSERRKEYFRLSAIAESHLTPSQRAAWSTILGEQVEFPKREANGAWVISYR